MKNYLFLFYFLSLCSIGFGQESVPVSVIQPIHLIGMVSIGHSGNVLIAEGKASGNLSVTLIDTGGRKKWTASVPKPKGKSNDPARILVKSDERLLYIIGSSEQKISVSGLELQSGSIFYSSLIIPAENDFLLSEDILVKEGQLYGFLNDSAGLRIIQYDLRKIFEGESGKTEKRLLPEILKNYPGHLAPLGFADNSCFAYSYTVSGSHNSLDVLLLEFDLKGNYKQSKQHTFKAEDHSFKFNAYFDRRLFYLMPGNTGWYLIGKLDMGTSKKYIENSAFEGCTGFWVAHIKEDLSLNYFSMQPFKECLANIPHGIIKRSVFIDFKEDDKNNLFVQFSEIPEAVAYNSYLFELDSKGEFMYLISGLSEYNFFNYNKRGVRNISRKSHIRLLNDSWRYYSSNFLDDIKINPNRHSNIVKFIVYQGKKTDLSHDRKAYNFSISSSNRALIYEYLDISGGKLNIYKIGLN